MALTQLEADAARATTVWIVWWEEPDRSWEALCPSAAEADREHESRQGNSLLARWGKVGRAGPCTLLQWYEENARASPERVDRLHEIVRTFLARAAAGEPGCLVVRA